MSHARDLAVRRRFLHAFGSLVRWQALELGRLRQARWSLAAGLWVGSGMLLPAAMGGELGLRLVERAASVWAMAAAGPLCLAYASGSLVAGEPGTGVRAFAGQVGLTRAAVAQARHLAVTWLVARATWIAALPCVAVFALTSPRPLRVAWMAAVFALLGASSSVFLVGLAALARRLAHPFGRTALVGLVGGSWLAAGALGLGAWSVPGSLGALVRWLASPMEGPP